MSHRIVHVELAAEDRAELGRFYQDVFGWQLQEYPEMNYTTFSSGDGSLGGGFSPVSEHNPRGSVVIYIETDDINATLEQIKQEGGETVWPQPLDVPGVGTIVHFRDPGGNLVALLQPVAEAM